MRETRTPHTLDEWVAAIGTDNLRKVGREWVGPCPRCGGHDRFHVGHGKRAAVVAGCRHGCGFPEIAVAVFGRDTASDWLPPHPLPRPVQRTSKPTTTISPTAVAVLWNQADECEGTPAAAYLRERLAWPPAGAGFPVIPEAVRWLPAAIVPRSLGSLPDNAAGCIAFRFTRRLNSETVVVAIHLDALQSSDGRRTATRWRRSYGETAGAVFQVPALVGGKILETAVRIVEGESTALAAALLNPTENIRAAGGTSGLALAALEGLSSDCRIVLEADGDAAGRKAAENLYRAARRAGFRVDVETRRDGDAADYLEEIVAEGLGLTKDLAAGWRRALTWLPKGSE